MTTSSRAHENWGSPQSTRPGGIDRAESRSHRSRFAALLVTVGITLAAGTVHAQAASQPSAADLESARELYRDGKELRQKGDLRGALERFKAAHGYGQTPVTGIELGKTHLQLGELVEAREMFLSIGRIKVASDETEKSASARTEAAQLAEQLRPRIPTLVVKVSGVKADAPAQVAIDGANAPVVSLSSMRKVNPGEHAIVVRVSGREEKRSVSLAEGETKEVDVAFTDASPKVADDATVGAGTPADNAASGSGGRPVHVVTWIGLGIGVAGIGLGAVTGVMALGKAGSVTDACRGVSCPPSARADVEDGRTVANISTIAFAVGAAGLATAAVGYFVLSPIRKTARTNGVHLALTPAWAGIHGDF